MASIVSISPNPANIGDTVTFTGQGNDPAGGTIVEYEWTSDGIVIGTDPVIDVPATSLGTGFHNIAFRVKNDSDIWSSPATSSVQIIDPSANIEYIFCCFGYYASDSRGQLTNYLNDIAVYEGNDVWRYTTPQKTYIITYVDTLEGMETALRTEGSHLLYSGHSNYGLGPLYSTIQEVQAQEINDVYYVDDPRILNISSEWVHVSVSGMRTGQVIGSDKDGGGPVLQLQKGVCAAHAFGCAHRLGQDHVFRVEQGALFAQGGPKALDTIP